MFNTKEENDIFDWELDIVLDDEQLPSSTKHQTSPVDTEGAMFDHLEANLLAKFMDREY